jgi:protocatechuate 3,4-dioxygenase beta subunit
LLGVTGELVRQDLLTGELGAITHLDVNIIDTSSCKPVTDAYVEMWGSNATGVYTGVQAKGNGDGSATAVKTNALRGVQPTGANGTATFITVIPGHYVGRTNHLHSKHSPTPFFICPVTNSPSHHPPRRQAPCQ